MAFDTAFNITWNQRVNKEETSMLKFLSKRKAEQEGDAPLAIASSSDRKTRKSMSEADLMSAIRSERQSNASEISRSRSDLRRRSSRGSQSSSVLQKAGSSVSSPSIGGSRRKAPPMTFEQMQEHVGNLSMNRYIKDLEKDAKEAAAENEWNKQKIKDGMQQQVEEKAKQRVIEKENGRQIQEQIEDNKGRRANTRKAYVEAASAHNFPLFTETFISQDEVDQYRKDVKVQFREELNEQFKTTQTLKNLEIKRDRIYAADKLAKNIKNMQDDHAKRHKENVAKGDKMMRVWDRDIRLKNIKNAILSGKDATKEMGVSSD